MPTEPLFSIPEPPGLDKVTIAFEGRTMTIPAGISVAAALLVSGVREFRSSVVSRSPRAPYCMMGVCFECPLEIDGIRARQSCMVTVRDGMQVRRHNDGAGLDGISSAEP